MADRTAVVVGVGSDVGRACAEALAREGASVLAVDPDRAVAQAVALDLGGRSHAHRADFASAADAADVAGRCRELWQGLDVLVDCGSAMEMWPESHDTPDRLIEIITTNLLGPFFYTNALQPLLATSRAGSVVYLGSIDAIRGNPNVPAYSASKGGLMALTHVMAQRGGTDGIRVNCVATGGIMQSGSGSAPLQRTTNDSDLLLRLTPLGRRPSPSEVASVVLFFASDDSSYVTGTVLPVDGGRTATTPGTW